LFTNTLFFTGQLYSFEIAAISFPLSSLSLTQSYSVWSTVWVPLAHGHSGDPIILNRCRYALVFPCAVIIAVILGVKVIFIFSLSLILGKTFFTYCSFCSVVPEMLPLFYACLYFTFCDFVVAYFTVSGGLLDTFVHKFVSFMSCVCLDPCVFYVSVFCLQFDGLFSDCLYEIISIFFVFKRI
jgi:hypothetical protein